MLKNLLNGFIYVLNGNEHNTVERSLGIIGVLRIEFFKNRLTKTETFDMTTLFRD